MPLDAIVEGFFEIILRFFKSIVWELLIETALRGPGYLICKSFKPNVDFEAGRVLFVGILFWIFFVGGGFVYLQHEPLPLN